LEPQSEHAPSAQSSPWLFALLGALLFGASYLSKRSQSLETVASQDNAAHRKQAAPAQALLVPNVPTQPGGSSPNRSKQRTPFWEKLAVLIALGLLVVNICQTRATRDAVTKAGEANQITTDALLYVQRAFVFINNFDVTRLTGSAGKLNGKMRVAFQWENGGNTGTKDMVTHSSIEWFAQPIDEHFSFPDYPENSAPLKIFVGPKSMTRSFPIVISPKDLLSVQHHTGHIYFWGWARYNDVFPKTARHVTRFCYELTDVIGDVFQSQTVNIQTSACSFGNCADGECATQ
jgi:hypothetical protein